MKIAVLEAWRAFRRANPSVSDTLHFFRRSAMAKKKRAKKAGKKAKKKASRRKKR